jgi:hypothetical protein
MEDRMKVCSICHFPYKGFGRKHNRSMMDVAAIIKEVLRRRKKEMIEAASP